MNVKEITEQYLRANGYDGLYNENGECGCERGDLMPCDCTGIEDCEPAMQHYCPACGESIFVPISSLEKLCRKLDESREGMQTLMLAKLPDDAKSIGVWTLPE